MSDETVRAKTGRDWQQWVRLLDRHGASRLPHREIAKYLVESHEIPGWWAQTVTVGFERIRGLRDHGQRRGGGYEANKSKTFAVPVQELYRAFAHKRWRQRWLVDVDPEVRKSTPDKSVRLLWLDGTKVEAYFTSKGENKSSVAIQHRELASKRAATRAKALWADRLAALDEQLRSGSR